MKNFLFVFMVVILVGLGVSCGPTRHYAFIAKHTKTTPQQKLMIAPRMAILFPPKEIYVPGVVSTHIDTVVDVDELLTLAAVIDSLLFECNVDKDSAQSISKGIITRFKTRTVQVTHRQVDTVYRADVARETSLKNDLANCEGLNKQLIIENDQLKAKVKEWYQDKWFWLFVAATVAFGLSTVLHFKRR